MTRGEALQMATVDASAEELVAWFSEHELSAEDGSALYRAARPAASICRTTLRIDPERIRDRRLRVLLGNGVIVTPSTDVVEIGCVRIEREGRDMRVLCVLGPQSAPRLLFTLRNVRNRLGYLPAAPAVPVSAQRRRAARQ